MLSSLEVEIIRAIASGGSDPQIADQLDRSETVLQEHVKEIMSKLNVSSRLELILLAYSEGSPIKLGRPAA
jgi:DNA-binding NarL/FixJ family response regulator